MQHLVCLRCITSLFCDRSRCILDEVVVFWHSHIHLLCSVLCQWLPWDVAISCWFISLPLEKCLGFRNISHPPWQVWYSFVLLLFSLHRLYPRWKTGCIKGSWCPSVIKSVCPSVFSVLCLSALKVRRDFLWSCQPFGSHLHPVI